MWINVSYLIQEVWIRHASHTTGVDLGWGREGCMPLLFPKKYYTFMFSLRSPNITLPLPRPPPLFKNPGSATGSCLHLDRDRDTWFPPPPPLTPPLIERQALSLIIRHRVGDEFIRITKSHGQNRSHLWMHQLVMHRLQQYKSTSDTC